VDVEELVRRAVQERDPEAFVQLCEYYRQDMLKVARSFCLPEADTADVLQETILSCWENLGKIREPNYFKTWLIRIVINKARDARRRQQRYVYTEQPETGSCEDRSDLEFRELMQCLDEKYRTVLVLYYAEGYSTTEIAELLDLSVPAVKSRLQRGRDQFRREYTKQDGGVDYA